MATTRIYTLFLLLLIPSVTISQVDYRRNAIKDPAIDRRCQQMETKRQKSIQHKNKLLVLFEKSDYILKSAPENKQTIAQKLQNTRDQIEMELIYTRKKIKKIEEEIILKGCPGVIL